MIQMKRPNIVAFIAIDKAGRAERVAVDYTQWVVRLAEIVTHGRGEVAQRARDLDLLIAETVTSLVEGEGVSDGEV